MAHDPIRWLAKSRLEKYRDGESDPYEVLEGDGNLVVTVGIQRVLDLMIGAGGTSYANANAYLGVGDSTTAAAVGQTDLQAATNKLRKVMDATYPSRAGQVVTFRSTFGTADANYVWNEWAVFNASTGATMLNRKVESLGTKASGNTWVLSVSISLA
ncbi:MAG: hypothetical protein H0V50_00795 [Thermoleophilaceae bacterium]|nr:hypothetical protein [Thermoleophilaceae bacterium]